MRKNHARIAVVLDRSGSMSVIRDDTVGGLNTFITENKKLPGTATFSLHQFDNVYETVIDRQDLQSVKLLTSEDFVPRGGTALLDAIGQTVNAVGNELAALAEADRPEKVILMIITDGYENCSKEFSRDKIFTMLKHQQEVYNWDVAYLGANQDAIAVGSTFGIGASGCMSYNATPEGAKMAFCSASNYSSTSRTTGRGSF